MTLRSFRLPTAVFIASTIALIVLLASLASALAADLASAPIKSEKRDVLEAFLAASATVVLWWVSLWQVCVLASVPTHRAAKALRIVVTVLAVAAGVVFAGRDHLALGLFIATILATICLDWWQRPSGLVPKPTAAQTPVKPLTTAVIAPFNAVFVLTTLQKWTRSRSTEDVRRLQDLVALPLRGGDLTIEVSPRGDLKLSVWTPTNGKHVYLQVTGSRRANRDAMHRLDGMLTVLSASSSTAPFR